MNQENSGHTDARPKHNFGFYLIQVIRIVVGLLFIFSGLIKANDPSGLAYKMQEFFEVWHMTGLAPMALGLSIFMIAFEIILGMALLLGYFFRFFSVLLLLLSVFFTFLTAYAVFSGKVKECGCFGDCIPLEAHESFIKDLILLVLVLLLFFARRLIRPLFKRFIGTSIMILTLFFSVFIQWWSLEHLPFVDCLPYKVGNNIWEKMQPPPNATPDVFQTTYFMKNTVTGATKKISDKEYLNSGIWKDSTWVMTGDPVTELIKKGNTTPEIQDFFISDYDGNNYTEALLKEPGYNFLLFIKDPQTANTRNVDRLKSLIAQCTKSNVGFFVLSSGTKAATEDFLHRYQLDAQPFLIDVTVCKTALRSNPGLMLIKAGTVIGKWSYNDYPQSLEWTSPDKLKIKK